MTDGPKAASDAVAPLLRRVVAGLPGGGEDRAGQVEMAQAVRHAVLERRHLVVQAGTGTGKSLAYLVGVLAEGTTVVVATATKGLQDQLAGKDLPMVAAHLGRPLRFAVLKGRSNYLCVQRLREVTGRDPRLELHDPAEQAPATEIAALVEWSGRTATGDRAELSFEPSPQAWSALSVGVRECPGASRCASAADCFAERARRAAGDADVVIVNTHLYALDMATLGAILPEHDVAVIDEAHELEAVVSATAGVEISAGRFAALARAARAVIHDPALDERIGRAGVALQETLEPEIGRRLTLPLPTAVVERVVSGREVVATLLGQARAVPTEGPGDLAARRERVVAAATSLIEDLDTVLAAGSSEVAWVDGRPGVAILRTTPIDVAELLRSGLWERRTAVLTSATIPPHIDRALGLAPTEHVSLDVGSPFDYSSNALLYCAAHLPDPRSADFETALHEELADLIVAAGGRTLALFTSWRAMDAAAAALAPRLDVPLLTQRDLPKPALLDAFREDEATCLFATLGFWQGIDVPGPALTLVTIDRLPFPRPDDPVLQARRERLKAEAFRLLDLPRAATLLAQGAGRLIRSRTDRGVVAVLDRRLATSTSYRWDLVAALPPMRRSRDKAEVESFLRSLSQPR